MAKYLTHLRLFSLLVCFAVTTYSIGSEIVVNQDTSDSKIIVCYFGSWVEYRQGDAAFKIENIDVNLCTHVIYSFAGLDSDTNAIVSLDPYLDFTKNGFQRFVNLKQQNPNLKTMLAIGGWNEGSVKYSDMASSPTSRATFVQSAVNFIRQYNFDGLDLDWEYPAGRGGKPEDKQNFVLLVQELREAFAPYGLLLSSAFGVGVSVMEKGYDFPNLCPNFDFINLMLYDLYGPWDNFTGHHTSFYNHPNIDQEFQYSVTDALDTISELGGCLEKMTLGMGMYGKTYKLQDVSQTDIGSPVSGPGTAGPFSLAEGTLGYNEICYLGGYTVQRDEYTMAPWGFKNDQWVCYDDRESIDLKCQHIFTRNMLGGMIWSIESDDFNNYCGDGKFSLLTQINLSLNGMNSLSTTTPMTPSSDKIIVCYFTNWSQYREGNGAFFIEDIDPYLCTHLIYSFALLDETTFTITPSDSWADLPSGLNGYGKFVNLKQQNPKLKTMIAIGGWNEGSEKYSDMAADSSKRTTFVNSVVTFIDTYGFDGLDLDWEYPANRGGVPEDKENFVKLVSELRTEFDKHGWLLTSAFGVGESVLESAYDFPSLCPHLDFLNLMMYDLHGSWDEMTGHHTSFYDHPDLGSIAYSLTSALDKIIELGGCPEKLALGMAMYGKTYTLTNSSNTDIGSPTSDAGNPGVYTKQAGMLGYNEIVLLTDYNVGQDNFTMAPWKYNSDQWICYDDAESLRFKSEWAIRQGLKGGMIWSMDTDDFKGTSGQGSFPLLTQIHTTFTEFTTVPSTVTTPLESVTTDGHGNQPENSLMWLYIACAVIGTLVLGAFVIYVIKTRRAKSQLSFL